MKKLKHLIIFGISLALITLSGCAPAHDTEMPKGKLADIYSSKLPKGPMPKRITTPTAKPNYQDDAQLPVRFQKPSYVMQNLGEGGAALKDEKIIIPVGADISSTTGPVELRDILKQLASLKNMNVSWASDVDSSELVDVDIRAEDDFFNAIDNLLRQKDYFHEVQGNTIVVKYKDTQTFHIAMPFLASKYTSNVGGDFLGSTKRSGDVQGRIQLNSEDNEFDIWGNIQKNIDQVLGIWEESAPAATSAAATPPANSNNATGGDAAASPAAGTPATTRNVKDGKGYYSVDKPIGLITVTAPRPLLKKIESYINNLKAELFKQISIEAKILEVQLDDSSTTGINWAGMLSGKNIDFELFGPQGVIYSTNPNDVGRGVSKISLPDQFLNPFQLVLDYLDTQGDAKVLSNPRLSVMNGQPAMISVGDSVSYIDSIETTISDTGIPTYTVNTDSVMSGLGLSVVATIMEGDEIILSLTPVTSDLEEPILYIPIGGGTVGLPKVRLREMSTTVRVKSGQVLAIGGLIDSYDEDSGNSVPLLSDLPLVGRLFSSKTKIKIKTELVILLQPKLL